jgi:hypothetical protein
MQELATGVELELARELEGQGQERAIGRLRAL